VALCPGLPWWANTRKVKPIWILLKQETVSRSGIGWAVCKSAPRSRQITTPAPHQSVFYRLDALPVAQPTASKHWSNFSKRSTKIILHDRCLMKMALVLCLAASSRWNCLDCEESTGLKNCLDFDNMIVTIPVEYPHILTCKYKTGIMLT